MDTRTLHNGDESFSALASGHGLNKGFMAMSRTPPAGDESPGTCRTRSRGRLPHPRAMTAGLVIAIAVAVAAHAGDAGTCAPEAVHADTEGQSLTRAEKIARMDRAFYDSLARFDECQSAATGAGAETGTGAAGADAAGAGAADAAGRNGGVAGADGDSVGMNDGASVASVAAEGIQGTESPEIPETDDTSIESVAAAGVRGTEAPEDSDATAPGTDRPPVAGSGQVPDDIPQPDNDSVLEAQIRRAAMEETDPRIRAELWNEYRKYKGLPLKPVPGEPVPGEEGENDDAQT